VTTSTLTASTNTDYEIEKLLTLLSGKLQIIRTITTHTSRSIYQQNLDLVKKKPKTLRKQNDASIFIQSILLTKEQS